MIFLKTFPVFVAHKINHVFYSQWYCRSDGIQRVPREGVGRWAEAVFGADAPVCRSVKVRGAPVIYEAS